MEGSELTPGPPLKASTYQSQKLRPPSGPAPNLRPKTSRVLPGVPFPRLRRARASGLKNLGNGRETGNFCDFGYLFHGKEVSDG